MSTTTVVLRERWYADLRARPQPPCPGKGYAGVARKGRFLAGGHLASSLWGLRNVLFPRRTGRSSVERWSQDVTGFSRPGVDHLSLQTTRFTSCIKMFFTSDRCKGLLRIYDIYRLFTLHFKW